MGSLSKLFQEHVQSKSCQSLLIHQEACLRHLQKDFLLYVASNFKYFIPICIIPAFIKLQSLNKTKLRNTLNYYLGCSLTGTAIGYTIDIFICLMRKLGHCNVYSLVFVPSAIGGCLLNFSSDRVQQLFKTALFQCNVESFFLMRRNFLSRTVADSRFLQTYIFMICSAIILQGKLLYNIKGFWLLEPNRKQMVVEKNEPINKCRLHARSTCQQHLWEGVRKYLILGLTLDTVKTLLNKVKVEDNQSKLWAKVKSFRLGSMALLPAYVGIYRLSHCLLNRYLLRDEALNHFTSAFLAGLCFNFYPQSTLFSYALIEAMRTIWNILQIENANTKCALVRFLLRFPMGRLLFPFAVGNSVHLICLKPKYCSGLTSAITNGVTNGYANRVQNVVKKLQRNVSGAMI